MSAQRVRGQSNNRRERSARSTKFRCYSDSKLPYERIGILPPPARAANNYRLYGEEHRRRLRFVRRTRELGFRLDEVRTLLNLIDAGDYTCDDMRCLAQGHLEEVRARLQDLQRLESTLADLVGQCAGGATPDCSLLETLFADADGDRPRSKLSPLAGR